ncbi:MFS transporter [Alkalimarinus coralli]|uniref:MFS transporter n=1 Tax=Alkalimarinus coralli TaxID=2935863 RepID=UPI00202B79B8|nr:MFS transporter [Alkalimarinus coralli]
MLFSDSRNRSLPVFTVVLLSSLYFSQGLPSGFLAHALPALLREYGVSVEYIGLLKLLALPWFLKFLWAPFVDRTELGKQGPHRGWILLMQSLLVVLMMLLSFSSPSALFGSLIIVFFVIVLMINTTAATQDIATDGLAVKMLPERWRGLGNSIQVSGFKIGMILSGSLLLVSVDKLGWAMSFQLMGLILFVLLLPAFLFKERSAYPESHAENLPSMSNERWFDAYKGFFSQPGIVYWLAVLFTYKIADSLGSGMIKPLLIDNGYSLTAVAELTFWASISGLLAAVAAGFIYYRIGAKWSLILFGLMQALGIAAYGLLATGNVSNDGVFVIALVEQAADGMSTVALFALMMGQCRKGHEGSDYTVQACIQVVMSGIVGALSGFVAKLAGYEVLYMLAGVLGVLALIPIYVYFSNTVDGAKENES